MTRLELAFAVLKVLDAQKRYFKSRDRDDLIVSKALEIALRKECGSIVGSGE